jgi:hypothetical protein
MSDDVKVCIACDQWDSARYTPLGERPFCSECFESLCDPDQTLLLEKRLAGYELELERLKALLA